MNFHIQNKEKLNEKKSSKTNGTNTHSIIFSTHTHTYIFRFYYKLGKKRTIIDKFLDYLRFKTKNWKIFTSKILFSNLMYHIDANKNKPQIKVKKMNLPNWQKLNKTKQRNNFIPGPIKGPFYKYAAIATYVSVLCTMYTPLIIFLRKKYLLLCFLCWLK